MKGNNFICSSCGNECKMFSLKNFPFYFIWNIIFVFVISSDLFANFPEWTKDILLYLSILYFFAACPKCGHCSLININTPMGRKLKAELAPYQNDDAATTKTSVKTETVKGKKSTTKTERKSKNK